MSSRDTSWRLTRQTLAESCECLDASCSLFSSQVAHTPPLLKMCLSSTCAKDRWYRASRSFALQSDMSF